MSVSEKKLLANRRNSLKARLKCSGPKDSSRTKYNALKHGLTSLQLTILPGEDEEEFRRFSKSLKDAFPPQNEVEKTMVVQITLCLWKLQRVMKVEQSIISEFTDLRGIRWDDLLNDGYLQKVAKYEHRIMNRLQKLLNNYFSNPSSKTISNTAI